MTIVSAPETPTGTADPGHYIAETMRVLIVAGIPAGALVVGLGSRFAMLVLRLTSPDTVHGVKSDDGFIIGRVTLGGTYNLMNLGALVGIIGAGAYMLVAPWLIGPKWFRRATTGLAAGAVVGSMLIHPNGIDFTRLKPTWLAIGLFVALPGVFGLLIGTFVDAVRQTDSWTTRNRRRWWLPVICVACFPLTLLPLGVALVIVLFSLMLIELRVVDLARRIPGYGLIVRALWMVIAVAGLVALVNDIDALTS